MEKISKTISEQIYEILREEIIEKKASLGEKLINAQLQKRFGVSSTPIRDAINRLAQDGLVETISKSGAKILDFNPRRLNNLGEMLTVFVIGAIDAYGFERITQNPKALKRLNDNLKKQEEHSNTISYYDYMYGFSQIIFESLENDEITKFVHKYTSLLQIFTKEEEGQIKDKRA